jgi:dipeptidyl aminopeptidase/acylaminoacyl peptidase
MGRYSFEQFAAIRSYAGLAFSPDGKHIAYTSNSSGQFNVWRQPVHLTDDGSALMPRQLTNLIDDVARTVAWSPDGEWILTTVDHHGNENYQVYRVPATDGWLYPVTTNPSARNEMAEDPFSPDGKRIAYASNERNPADFDVVVRELDGEIGTPDRGAGEAKPIVSGDGIFAPASWSPDGSRLLVLKLLSNTNQDLYVCDVASGEMRHLTPHDGDTIYLPGPWAGDGRSFYALTNQEREFNALVSVDLEHSGLRWVETPDWDVEGVALSQDDRFMAWLTNEDGYSRLQVRDLTTGAIRELTDLPRGVYSAIRFSPTEPLLAMYISRSVRPADLYIVNVETGEHWVLTQSFLGGVPEGDMIEPELIRYTSFDGRQVPAFLYRPREASAGPKVPLVLSIHGGPESQERPVYNYWGFYQYLLSLGIGVIATNVRGSTGYGISYQKLIHRDWGGAELKDFERAAKYAQSLDWVDPERLGVFGGSFGGFATLSCVSRLPEYWSAAVDIFGPANLQTFARSVPEFWKRMMKLWVGDPDEDAEMLKERSPITYVDEIRAPLLVIQGANDPRVVKPESDQIVERLRQNGQTVEYMVFDDEGHGFTKTANWHKALGAAAGWLETYLQPRDRNQDVTENETAAATT